MTNVFLINAHEEYPFSQGKLNQALVERVRQHCAERGYEVKLTTMKDELDVDREIERHRWADVIFLQTPTNWMGVPWSFKRYMDTVYSAGMDGRLCLGNGRSRQQPEKQYGSGGTLEGTKYAISLTFNAPRESFNDPSQTFFEGRSIDDLFLPTHLNFRFFGMEPLPSFACYDVMKNPDIENDFVRFDAYLESLFPGTKRGASL
ncbi:MAG: NAD(P)H-dependent oxidoreductase [Acidobacteriota bacterium]